MTPRDRESRRDRIETAAGQEFSDFGFHGARVDRIARAAGVNKQLIYYYFGSKRGLYQETLRRATESLRLAPAERRQLPGSPAERVRHLLAQSMERAAASPDVLRTALMPVGQDAATGRGALAELAEEFAREISRGQGLGYFRDDADPTLLGQQAAVLVLGWVAMSDVPSPSGTAPALGEWVAAAADLLGRALAW